MNLSQGNVHSETKFVDNWILTTYINTISLPGTKVDNFNSKNESIKYIKNVEYKIPLISNDGTSLDIPNDVNIWEFWIEWLEDRSLFSTLEGFQHVPYWVDPRGYRKINHYMNVVEVTKEDFEEDEKI